jgi:HEAT repeat protein
MRIQPDLILIRDLREELKHDNDRDEYVRVLVSYNKGLITLKEALNVIVNIMDAEDERIRETEPVFEV